jgi:hypothetical protein
VRRQAEPRGIVRILDDFEIEAGVPAGVQHAQLPGQSCRIGLWPHCADGQHHFVRHHIEPDSFRRSNGDGGAVDAYRRKKGIFASGLAQCFRVG